MTEAEASDPRQQRHCIKCGREIGPDESICEVCNRAGMATPSASQYHGTMVVAIIAGVVGLAIWASLAMRGVGPYQAEVVSVTAGAADAAVVTFTVENQGTSRGSASCRLEARDANGFADPGDERDHRADRRRSDQHLHRPDRRAAAAARVGRGDLPLAVACGRA